MIRIASNEPMKITEADNLLFQAIRRLLKPLVRLFIRKNVPLQVMIDLLKEIYVNIAEESLKAEGIKATDSQISLMTGVHRRDVREYRDHTPDTSRELPHVSMGAEVIAIWVGNPQFLGADNQPCPLPYANKDNPAFSFTALAESVSTDVRPRAILDELRRQNIVRYDEVTDNVWLNTEAFVPQEGWAEKLYYFGRNGQDHLEAAVENILSQQPPFLDRSVYYGGLTKTSVEELQKISREHAMRSLRTVNRRAHDLSERDKTALNATHRITFGTYFFSDTEDPDPGKKGG